MVISSSIHYLRTIQLTSIIHAMTSTNATFVCDPNAVCVNFILEAALHAIGGEACECQCQPGLKASVVNETLWYALCSDVDKCNLDDPNFVNFCGPIAECVNYDPRWDNIPVTFGILNYCQCKDRLKTDGEVRSIIPHAKEYAFKCTD